jgi:hypothetical protein
MEDAMRRVIFGALVVATLAVAGTANAGGWATVQLAGLPEGTKAGQTWDAKFTVLRHGRTPTSGAQPKVLIRNGSGTIKEFTAKPTGRTGEYEAKVVFPTAGKWTFRINDGLAATNYGMSQVHGYPAVQVSPGGGGGDGTFFPLGPSLAGIALVVLLGAALALLARRQRRTAAIPA